MHPDVQRPTFGPKTLCYLEADMARYVHNAGAMPLLIPDLDKVGRQRFIDTIDGLLLQGGADVSPLSYGEQPILDSRWPGDKIRDEYELELIDLAIKSGKPVFGICRGFQILNVYFGGTLYQDLITQRKGSLTHRDAIVYDRLTHQIQFEKGSFFDKLYTNELRTEVNTVHHQGVKDLGRNLEVGARCAEDGLIEAFTSTEADPGRVMAVQWHPEFFHTLGNRLIEPNCLINTFLDQCQKR